MTGVLVTITSLVECMSMLMPVGYEFTAVVALAHVGVIRRWHPAIRVAVYGVTFGLGAAGTYWASGG